MSARVKAVLFEDGNGREWWQIAVRQGPWWWPRWRWVRCVTVHGPTGTVLDVSPAEWTTREEAMEAMRGVADRVRAGQARRVEEVVR